MSSLPRRAGSVPDPAPVDARELLTQVVDRYGDRVVLATSLGPQTLVILDLLHRLGRQVPVIFLDTGVLFDETYALRRVIEHRYGLSITVVRNPALPAAADRLWQRDPDRCCHLRKVVPLQAALRGRDAWFTGLRRDQSTTRANIRQVEWDDRHGLVKLNPLAYWSRDEVFAYLRAHDVPTNPLLDDGYLSVGCRPCTTRAPAGDERGGRWAGSSKTECGIHFLYKTSPPSGDVR